MLSIEKLIIVCVFVTASMAHASEECIKPQVPNASHVSCLGGDKLTVATLDNTSWALVNEKGELLTDYVFDNIIYINDTLIGVTKGNKEGIINKQGEQILPTVYDGITLYDNHYFRLHQDGKYGVADPLGNIVLPLEYDGIGSLDSDDNRNRVIISKQQKRGLIDEEGNIILPAKYDLLFCCRATNYGKVAIGNLYGLISLSGAPLTPVEYQSIETFSYEPMILKAKKQGKWGLMDVKGNVLHPFEFDQLPRFYPDEVGIETFKKDGKIGFINNEGKIVSSANYDSISIFDDKKYELKNDNLYGLADTAGQLIVPVEYDDISLADEQGLRVVEKNEKYGLINGAGEILLAVEYDKLGYPDDESGVRTIRKEDKYGLIDRHGSILISPEYDMLICCYANGYGSIAKGNSQGVIDSSGKIYLSDDYDYEGVSPNGLLLVVRDGLQGLANKEGQLITPIIYEDISQFSDDLSAVQKDDK